MSQIKRKVIYAPDSRLDMYEKHHNLVMHYNLKTKTMQELRNALATEIEADPSLRPDFYTRIPVPKPKKSVDISAEEFLLEKDTSLNSSVNEIGNTLTHSDEMRKSDEDAKSLEQIPASMDITEDPLAA
jgi:hypothetical protein